MTRTHQQDLMKILDEIKQNPIEADRIRQAVSGTKTFSDSSLQKEYENILKHEAKVRRASFNKGRKRIDTGKDFNSPLHQSLHLSLAQLYKDVRFSMGDLEIKSGIPFYEKHYTGISKNYSLKAKENEKVTDTYLEPLGKLTIEEQQNISQHFEDIYEKKFPINLSANELKATELIRGLMYHYRDFIKKYRFMQWLESKLAGENRGLGQTDIPNVTQPQLEEGLRVWQRGGEEALDMWLPGQDFAIIKEGYVPRAILGGRLKFPLYNVGIFTRRMLKPRHAKVDLSNVPLVLRVRRYLNAILNLKFMEKPIGALDQDLSALKEGGHIPTDTVTKIQHWVDRVKGFRGENTGLDKILRSVQRTLHRTITVRPKLWFRNLFQRKITPPFRKPVVDPKLTFKRFQDLTDEDKDYFHTFVNQFTAMKQEYLYFLEGRRTKIPVARQFVGLAEFVGQTYPLTDMWNRASVYGKTIFYTRRAIKAYGEGKISFEKLKNNTGFHNMKSFEQRRFLEILQRSPEDLARFIGKWNSDNSQWMYNMTERSLEELTPQRAAIYNLFVWSKSIAQLVANLSGKVVAGRTFAERRSGLVGLVGHVLSSELARRVVNKVYGKAKVSMYDGYNIVQSFLWTIGGATLSEINDIMEAAGKFIFAYTSGTDQDKSRATANFTREIDSSSNLLIPFLDPMLALIEALTDTKYISPIYNQFVKKAKPISRSTFQKFQHALFRQVRGKRQTGMSDTTRAIFKKYGMVLPSTGSILKKHGITIPSTKKIIKKYGDL